MTNSEHQKFHHFLDEAGDTTFFGQGKICILGNEGVSKYFILGKVHFNGKLQTIRNQITDLENEIETNAYYRIASVNRKISRAGKFYFHATDDIPEIRKLFFDLIKSVDCAFEAVVAKKDFLKFVKRNNGNDKEFYAELLSHLLHQKLEDNNCKHIFIISQRGNTTRLSNLENGLNKAIEILKNNKPAAIQKSQIVFDVMNPKHEPLLNLADYICWAVQRKYEKGEERFFNYIKEKIVNIIDI